MTPDEYRNAGAMIVTVETRYGEFFLPNVPDLIASSLFEYGEWAQAEINILCDFIMDSDNVIDARACFGTYARAFSDKVGSGGRVVCFEPALQSREILEKNARAATFNNIIVYGFASGAEAAQGQMASQMDDNQGANRLIVSENDNEIEVLHLDEDVDHVVNFIKLDLEGSEFSALLGATRILTFDKPVVFMKVLDLQAGAPILAYMTDIGYICYGVNTPAFRPENFNSSTRDIFQGGTECGLLFVHSESLERFSTALAIHALPRIVTVDDLFLLLFQQPQYRLRTLSNRPAAQQLTPPNRPGQSSFISLEILNTRNLLEAQSAELAYAKHTIGARTTELALSYHTVEARTAELAQANHTVEARAAELYHVREKFRQYHQDQQRLLNDLDILIEEWQVLNLYLVRLAKRVRAFPFALYFRLKKRYRRSTRQLLRFPDQPAIAKSLLEALVTNSKLASSEYGVTVPSLRSSSQTAPVVRSGLQEVHPIGYKANILSHLKLMDDVVLPTETKPMQFIVSAAVLIERTSISRNLVISFSHDNYLSSMGGTQLCIGLEQRAAIDAHYDYLHVFPLVLSPGMAARSNAIEPSLGVSINGVMQGVTSYQTLIDLALARGKNTHVVLHHLLGHVPEEVSEVIKASKDTAPIFWLHDFFTLCQSPHLLRNKVSFCGGPQPSSMSCGICSFGTSRTIHLDRMTKLFGAVLFRLAAPSEFAAEIFRTKSDLPYASLSVLPHVTLETVPASEDPGTIIGSIRIAFIGFAVDHKGWPNFLNAFEQFGKQHRYQFYYFGVSEVSESIISVEVAAKGSDSGAMIRALRKHEIDIVVHISATPETFSFSVHEALAAGASVITNRQAGNTARVIERAERGIVLEKESDLLAAFESGDIERLAYETRQRRRKLEDRANYSRLSFNLLAFEETF